MALFARKNRDSKSLFDAAGVTHTALLGVACAGGLLLWAIHQQGLSQLQQRIDSIVVIERQSERLASSAEVLLALRNSGNAQLVADRLREAQKSWSQASDTVIGALAKEGDAEPVEISSIKAAESAFGTDILSVLAGHTANSVESDQKAYVESMRPIEAALKDRTTSRLPILLWGFALLALLVVDALVLFPKALARARQRLENDLYETLFERDRKHREQTEKVGEAANKALKEKQIELEAHAQALEIALKRAEEASRLKSAFLANMSHEIRTPMNGVIGMAQVLAQSNLTVEQADWVATMISSGDQLVRIINDILDLSQVEAGKLQLELRPVEPRQFITEAIRPFEAQVKDKGLTLNVILGERSNQAVLLDPERVRQIITNLLSNAVRFTKNGRIDVSVETVPTEGASEFVLRVKDTGVGIPAERLSAIFESFTQADVSTKRVFGGTGLGLTIVKQLTELMNGTVSVTSTMKVGTEFVVRIPVETSQAQPQESTKAVAPVVESPQLGLNCLVVEDNPVNQKVVTKLLARLGCSAEVAPDGGVALQKMLGTHYDVILMDIHMPNMDGVEATRAIRKREKEWSRRRTPIIAVTADAMEEDRKLFMDAGIDNYVPKPVRQAELLEVLLPLSSVAVS